MNDTLPTQGASVNDQPAETITQLEPCEIERRAQDIAALVLLTFAHFVSIKPEDRLKDAVLAVECVAVWHAQSKCMCTACLKKVADGEAWFYCCLRGAVSSITGKSALQIPHSDDTRK